MQVAIGCFIALCCRVLFLICIAALERVILVFSPRPSELVVDGRRVTEAYREPRFKPLRKAQQVYLDELRGEGEMWSTTTSSDEAEAEPVAEAVAETVRQARPPWPPRELTAGGELLSCEEPQQLQPRSKQQQPQQLFVLIQGTGKTHTICTTSPGQSLASIRHKVLVQLQVPRTATGATRLQLRTAANAVLALESTVAELNSPFIQLGVWPDQAWSHHRCASGVCPFFGTVLKEGLCSVCFDHKERCLEHSEALMGGGLGGCISLVISHLQPRDWRALLLVNRAWREDVRSQGPYSVSMSYPNVLLTQLQYRLLMRVRLFRPLEAFISGATSGMFLHEPSQHLATLTLSHCAPMANLMQLGACTRLKTLRLHDCVALPSLGGLSACPCLRELTLRNCCLTDLSELLHCEALRMLTLEDVNHTTDLATLAPAPTFTSGAEDAGGEGGGGGLETLTLIWCCGLDLAPLTRCAVLRTLCLQHCRCFSGIQALAYAPLRLLRWGGLCDEPTKDGLLLLSRLIKDHISDSQLKLEPGGEVLEEDDDGVESEEGDGD